MTLALDLKEVYPTSLIDLKVMPPLSEQQKQIDRFQRIVQDRMRKSLREEESLSYVQAERLAWQQIEETLLRLTESRDTATI